MAQKTIVTGSFVNNEGEEVVTTKTIDVPGADVEPAEFAHELPERLTMKELADAHNALVQALVSAGVLTLPADSTPVPEPAPEGDSTAVPATEETPTEEQVDAAAE